LVNPNAVADQRALQNGLIRLSQSLDSLPLSPAEIQRRRRLIQHLEQQQQSTATGSSNAPSTSATSQPQQQQQVSSQINLAMQQQDNLIDELAVGVSRLKTQSQVIGEESRMHVNLLSDMEQHLDEAHSGLENETRRAAQLREDQSLWRLQLIVAGLCILLVLLIVLGLS
jgi:cobalamin biosynthesis Mg chelatase CobN